jgi:hypothetical protein
MDQIANLHCQLLFGQTSPNFLSQQPSPALKRGQFGLLTLRSFPQGMLRSFGSMSKFFTNHDAQAIKRLQGIAHSLHCSCPPRGRSRNSSCSCWAGTNLVVVHLKACFVDDLQHSGFIHRHTCMCDHQSDCQRRASCRLDVNISGGESPHPSGSFRCDLDTSRTIHR